MNTPDQESFPARLAIAVVKSLSDEAILTWLPWDKLKPSFETLLANYDTNMTRNWYLRLACAAHDASVVKRMVYILGSNNIDSTFWSDQKGFRECLATIGTSEPSPIASERVNLLAGAKWEPYGEAWSTEKTQHIQNGGRISAKTKFASRSGGCALVGSKVKYKRPHTTITSLPKIGGYLMTDNKIIVTLHVVPVAKQADTVSLWNVYPITGEINNAIVHLDSSLRKGDDPSSSKAEFSNNTLMFFPSCDEAKAAAKQLFPQP